MINQSINLNLIPGAIPPRIKVSQYDEGSRTLIFMLYNGSSQYAGETGITAKIQGTKPDGHGFCYDATYGQETGYCYVTADLTRQMTVVAGAVTCEIVLEKNSQVLGTGNFILDVEAGALSDDTDTSDTEIPAIIDAAETNAERAEDAADRAEAASAHAPYIGNNEHWYVWDSTNSQYVDSGVDAKGEDGASIVSVTKTSTSGYVDTYTITMSDGTTSTFTVTNGTSALPGGGTKGQVLTKKSDTTGDADWSSDLELGKVGWDAAASSVKKNLLKNTAVSGSQNGITWTVNADKTVKADTGSGSATANTNLVLNYLHESDMPSGNYIVSTGNPQANVGVIVEAFVGTTTWVRVLASCFSTDNVAMSLDWSGYDTLRVSVHMDSGKSASNVTVYPMIRPASITNADYAPWIPDNTELVPWSANGVLGAKNWFTTSNIKHGADMFSESGENIRITVGTAGTYKNTGFYVPVEPHKAYTVTANIQITSGVGYVNVYTKNGSTKLGDTQQYTSNTSVTFSFNSGNETEVLISMFCTYGTSETGDVTYNKFMLRLAADSDSTYAPYAMTNRELTALQTVETLSETLNGFTATFVKVGHLAQVTIGGGSLTADVAANAKIFDVPSGYTPKANADFVCTADGKRFMINTSGQLIPANHAITTGYVLRGSVTYIV